ncbi:virulence-associated E family protein [Aliarcobacter butzleri]|uniref:virulence-associated E family protein n=1 Tax=Aliarcobacter butzleri TaxID=28197 RepID=UPI0021B2FA40|nr:virulence-associated E family protein [Aliarcobacter butzleri]MCT7634753.1 virulence-associated E family protein [Aliarcobacter butzleri]
MNSISYMPKLVSDFELSNKLIDEAKIKAKPESERIKKSQKQELITILVKNGISKKEAIKMASDSIDKLSLDPSFIIKFNDGKEVLVGVIKACPQLYEGHYVADPFSIEDDGTQKAIILPDGNIYSFKHGGYTIRTNTSVAHVIDRINKIQNVYSELEALGLKDEFEKILSNIEDLSKKDIREIKTLLKTKGVIKNLDDLNVKLYSRYELSSEGRPLSTDKNLEELLRKYGFEFFYDEIAKELTITHPEISESTDNDLGVAYSIIQSYAERDNFKKDIIEHLGPLLMNKFAINPLKDMVEDAISKYDGQDYIKKLVDCLELNSTYQYKYVIVRLWLIQCVASWFHENEKCPVKGAYMKFEQVLLIQGMQGLSKTKLFSKLLDFNGMNKYFKAGAKLNPSDKDTIIQSNGYGIVELGEIDATFRKSDIAELKAFLSNTYDQVRLPYDRTASKYKRRTSFCASVNETSFLVDMTGNRRFLILPLLAINFIKVEEIDFFQLWGQIGTMYKNGAKWWLDRDNIDDKIILDELEQLHNSHIKTTMIDDIVCEIVAKIEHIKSQSSFPSFQSNNGQIMQTTFSPTKILQYFGIQKPNRNEIAEFKEKMAKAGFEFNKASTLRLPSNLLM